MTILKHPFAECTEKAEVSVPEQAALKGGTTLDRNDITATFGLTNGGTAGAIYIYIFTFLGFGMAIVSMAEMASMYGNGVLRLKRFANEVVRKVRQPREDNIIGFLNYVTGWLCVLGWQAGAASGCYLAGTEIQGLVILNHPDYTPERWHGSLIAIALVFVSLFINTVLAKSLPSIEGVLLLLHVFGFVAITTTVWSLSPHSSATEVFTKFNDGGDWHNVGLATLVGILSPTVSLIGPDAIAHISEEVRDASKTIPRIMLAAVGANAVLGFVMLVTICFCLGNLDEVLSSSTGYPFIQIFFNATRSNGGATSMTAILIVLTFAGALSNMATGSRSADYYQVHAGRDIPTNAILATTVISVLLISISFGSTIAFNQLIALGTVALLCSYMGSIGSMALLRIRGRQPSRGQYFSLGRWGLLVNVLALMFLALAFVMIFFPPMRNPDLESMNWSVVIFSGVLLASVLYYYSGAKAFYIAPVELVKLS
ncbi:MAG: hypothetical protein Q9191_001571 [Dirinaria sp. TL-2023a]